MDQIAESYFVVDVNEEKLTDFIFNVLHTKESNVVSITWCSCKPI